jgi:hypothetical protein
MEANIRKVSARETCRHPLTTEQEDEEGGERDEY